jgi:hypothetical protein
MSAARLQTLLGLSDDELLRMLDSDPLAVITGEEDERQEIHILLQLLAEPLEARSEATLRRWARTGSPSPVDLLVRRDFAGFEDALTDLNQRGFVIRSRNPPR